MKKIVFILCLLVIGLLHATIITVDNSPYSMGDYTSIEAAHDAAVDGDEIHVYPSYIAYPGITITKRLYIYGVGYEINDSPGETSIRTASISGILTMHTGSEGSIVEGFDGHFYCNIYYPDITIKRNNLRRISILNDNIAGIIIIQNRITNSDNECIVFNDDNIEAFIIDNILLSTGITNTILFSSGVDNNIAIIENNIISSDYYSIRSFSNSSIIQFQNNIMISGATSFDGLVNYNLCHSSQFPDNGTNILNVDMNTVFEDYTNNDYNLLQGSPAIDTGNPSAVYNDLDGTRNDMGVYGGPTPYIDTGMPGLPSIFYLQGPLIGSQQSGLDVIIKAKSNKE
jgi:hypothetical protein